MQYSVTRCPECATKIKILDSQEPDIVLSQHRHTEHDVPFDKFTVFWLARERQREAERDKRREKEEETWY